MAGRGSTHQRLLAPLSLAHTRHWHCRARTINVSAHLCTKKLQAKRSERRPKYAKMPNEKFACQVDEKKPKNANKPNTKSTGQSAFNKAKFQLFGLEKCQMATLMSVSSNSEIRGLPVTRFLSEKFRCLGWAMGFCEFDEIN